MKTLPVLCLLWLGPLAPQDPAALIEQLRSDDIAVREQAFNELEKLGAAAEPALKKGAGDSDQAVSRDARRLLRILEFERVLSPAMKEAFPGICRRLGRGAGDEATKVYLEVAKARPDDQGNAPHAGLTRADLEPLALDAIRNAITPEDKSSACNTAAGWFHRSAQPAVMSLIRDADASVRRFAYNTLRSFMGRAALPTILDALRDTPALQVDAINALDPSTAYEAQGRLLELLKHADEDVVAASLGPLVDLDVANLDPEIRRLLKSNSAVVRKAALEYLDSFESRDAAGDVKVLVEDPDPAVRAAAVRYFWNGDLSVPPAAVLRVLEESDENSFENIVGKAPKSAGQDPAILECIRKRLKKGDLYVLRALQRLEDPQFEDICIGLVDHEDESIRTAAFYAMSETGSRRSIDIMRETLQDESKDRRLRCTAFDTLASLKSLPPDSELMALLRGKDIPLATQIARHFATSRPDLVRKEVPRILLDESSRDSSAAWGLAALMEPEARVPLLLKALETFAGSSSYVRWVIREHKADGYVPGLLALLEKGRPAAQSAAIDVLATLEAVETRPAIVNLLSSAEVYVRSSAIDALSDFGLESDVDEIRRLTRDVEVPVRSSALGALRRHEVKAAVPEFVTLMDDSNWNIAKDAAETLVEMGCAEAVPKLVEWLRHEERQFCNLAAEALSVLQPAAAEPGILAMLDHRDYEVRSRGAWMLQMFGMKQEVRRLLPFLTEPNLAEEAVFSLVVLDAKELIPDLEALISDPSPVRRRAALDALKGLQSVASIPRLRKLLDDPDLDIRREAAVSFGKFKDREAVPRLIEILREPVRPLRVAASRALGHIGDPRAVPALMRLLENPAGDMFPPAVFALGLMRAAEAGPELLRCLREVPNHRDLIIEALGNLGTKEAIPDLIKYIGDLNFADNAALALAKLNAKEALPAIRRRIEARNTTEFFDLATALADLGDSSALVEALASKEEFFKREAAKELCARGDMRGVPVLLEDRTFEDVPPELNAVRHPKLWRELSSFPWNVRLRGTRGRVLERIASSVGMTIKWEGARTFEELTSASAWESVNWWKGHSSVTEALIKATIVEEPQRSISVPPGVALILDPGVIRLLPHDRALEFWKQWWADEQAKKK